MCIRDSSYYTYNEQQENVMLSDILSDVDGDTYSVVAEGIYEKRFKTNKLSVGLNHRLRYVDNVYEGTTCLLYTYSCFFLSLWKIRAA